MLKTLTSIVRAGVLACLASATCAQDGGSGKTSGGSFADRLFFGGNFGLQFGTVTVIDISPMVGYKITERLGAGVGATYLYYRDNPLDFSTSMYGGRLFARYIITENIFAHAEYELLNREVFDLYGDRSRVNVEGLYVGGGLRQQLGGNTYFMLLILYNLNDGIYSPYSNPIIRAGISVGM